MSALLSARGVKKAFGPTVALAGVDLEVRAGEVLAIVGQNGAGKSTLIGVLGGVTRPDAGDLDLGGAPYSPKSPRDAIAAGIATVHQELVLCPHLSVAENVMLGREPTHALGLVDRRELARRAVVALESAAGEARAKAIGLDTRVGDLALADRQLVEIARALANDACRVLVLDEPTSSLGRAEAEVLWGRLRALRERGLAIVYISHFLEEVRQIADRFVVLRDGLTVASGDVRDVSVADLVARMSGRPASAKEGERRARAAGEVVLVSEGLGAKERVRAASFELRRGEVLGIAGIVGAGRTELLRVLFGLDPMEHGNVRAFGQDGWQPAPVRIAAGFGMLSEDRKGEGLFLSMSIADNLTLSSLPPVVRPAEQRAVAGALVRRVGVRCRDVEQPVVDLSGGNQQKVALGRLLAQDAGIVLLDQPTRGVDVGAKEEVHRLVDDLAARGKAILLVSDDLGELLRVSDRIAVMRRGVLGTARPASEWTEESLLAEAIGAAA